MWKGKEAKKMLHEDEALQKYSMRLFGSQLANLGVTLLLGIVSGRWLEIILFVISFVTLRRYAGGYHCKNSRTCFWMSSLIMAIAVYGIVLLEIWINTERSIILWLCLWEMAAGCFILLAAPVEAPEKPLDAQEKKVYGKRARITLVIQMAVGYLCLFYFKEIGVVVVISHSIIAISMLAGRCLQSAKRT